MLRDARVSQQQFSSQPVLLARSYESIHLKLGNLTSASLPAKSHLLPLELFFLSFPFIFWLSSQERLMWFTGGVDCSSLGLFLWAQRQKYVSKNKKKQRKRIGDVSRNYEWKRADLSPRLIGKHKCSQRGWNTKGNMLQAAGRGRDWLPAGGTKEVGWRWEDEAARLKRAVDGRIRRRQEQLHVRYRHGSPAAVTAHTGAAGHQHSLLLQPPTHTSGRSVARKRGIPTILFAMCWVF